MYILLLLSAEAMNNFCGIGFNGFDENGRARWNRMTIVNILKIEVRLCVYVLFFFCPNYWIFWGFSTIFPFSFAFLSVCNESEGSTRQLEYLYSPVVEKVCCYLFID